jgi:hypothetical protein
VTADFKPFVALGTVQLFESELMSDQTVAKAIKWRLEYYRHQTTFPQLDGAAVHAPSDESHF